MFCTGRSKEKAITRSQATTRSEKRGMRRSSMSHQRGYTLIELIIVLALVGIIGAAATMAITQIITVSILANDQNTAVNQVRNAGHWIGRDGQTAKEVNPSPGGDKLLELTVWDNSVGSANHTVSYTFVSPVVPPDYPSELRRDLNDVPGIMVAEYIDPDQTSCSWDEDERVLTVIVTARMPGWKDEKIETRTFEIKPRPDEPDEGA